MIPEALDFSSFAYRDIIGQDTWLAWSPVRTGWTDSGTPAVLGRYRKVGRQVFCQVKVTPGTTCATTAGTSYVNCPIAAAGYGGDGSMGLSPNVLVGSVMVDATNSRVYVPTQAATANTFIICWWYEV